MAQINENKSSKNVNLKARKEGWKETNIQKTNKTLFDINRTFY
jgi:hypothetical protein